MLSIIESLYASKGRPLSIGFSGAGGKTTNIYSLADELIKNRQKVLITTTTKMYLKDFLGKKPIVIRETFSETFLNNRDVCQWFSSGNKEGKGMAPQNNEIEKVNNNPFFWKLIEIDGSRHRPLKAHKADEPVYVAGLDLVFGVIGASALGKPATTDVVHRLEAFLEISGAKVGELITPEHLRRLIDHPKGLFKDLPVGVQPCVLLTQVRETDLAWVSVLKDQIHYPLEVIPWQAV